MWFCNLVMHLCKELPVTLNFGGLAEKFSTEPSAAFTLHVAGQCS